MSVDDSELREYTHGLFGSIAAALKQDFQPYLATCVAAALASCDQVTLNPASHVNLTVCITCIADLMIAPNLNHGLK